MRADQYVPVRTMHTVSILLVRVAYHTPVLLSTYLHTSYAHTHTRTNPRVCCYQGGEQVTCQVTWGMSGEYQNLKLAVWEPMVERGVVQVWTMRLRVAV